MSTSKNGLDAFERSLRESLDQFEVPYNSADWTQMERSLNGGNRRWWLGPAGLSVLVAGVVLIGGATWYAVNGGNAIDPDASDANVVTNAVTLNEGVPADRAANADQAEQLTPTVTQETTQQTSMDVIGANNKANTAQATTAKTKGVDPDPSTSPTQKVRQDAAATSAKASTATISASNPNEITFKASVAEACPGTSVDFKVSNMPADGIYLWNFGDGSFSNKANPEHTFSKPGSYQVMLSMSAAGVGTIQNKPSSDVIVIHDAPMAAFNVLKQEYDGHLPSVHFENRSLAGKQYVWDFGDGQTSTIAHPDHIYKKQGVYQVELTVTNEIGCEDKVMKDVRIDKDYNLDAPASFSPNGDDFQETFMPEALRTLGVKFNLTVYSSNGTLLYQTNDASAPWTGRPQNRGTLCGPGEYVWVVDVRESLHLAETYTGKVKLDR